MIARSNRSGWTFVAACAAVATLATLATDVARAAGGAEDPDGIPSRFARNPVAGTIALEDNRFWWGLDGVVPLGFLGGLRAPRDRASQLGLALSIAGSDTALVHDLGYTALLERRTPRAGTWFGLSTGRDGPTGSRLKIGTGLWHEFAPIEVEAGFVTGMVGTTEQRADHWGYYRNFRDTLSWVDTTTFRSVDRPELHTTAQSALHWQLGRVELAAIGGVTLRGTHTPQRWAQAAVNVRATPQLLVTAAIGQRPVASLAFDPAAGPRTMLGFRFEPLAGHPIEAPAAPGIRTWTTRRLAEERTAVRVRCPDATRVELAGDFTDWTPVSLAPLGGGWWGGEWVVAAGLHQVQVRVDGGEWQPPPGLPTTQGDFAGKAGVLLVE